ncbi:MAG TPA: DUF4240 domain-containing protein [Phototrophicaceae bacterium]|nr:DUF4240 domain-containing protein [Phototrophicaceae bacterium]
MHIDEFWELIEQTHRESDGVSPRQSELLIAALVQMDEAEIVRFDYIFMTLMNRAYTTDVWNAAYIMTSCGDDSFSDFRGWLIAQGKAIYENVLHDPDSLADIVALGQEDETTWESFSYVASKAYNQKTGSEDGVPVQGFHPVLTGNLPLGNPDESYRQTYPKLWAKFGHLWQESDEQETDQP